MAKNVDPVLKLETLQSKKTALERDLYYLVRKPIPQWYKDKLSKMMEALKNSTKTEEAKKEGTADGKDGDGKEKEGSDSTDTGDKSEEKPAETPKEESSEDKPKEESAGDKPKEESSAEDKPKEDSTADNSQEESSDEKPKDEAKEGSKTVDDSKEEL